MDRRGFLHGLFGGVTSAGLIVVASPNQVEAFASGLVKDAPVLLDAPPQKPVVAGEHLYNARGECVAMVTGIRVNGHYLQGGVTIQATCSGPLEWDGDVQAPRLRGQSNVRAQGQ